MKLRVKTLILHIGRQKTGSTAIQNVLDTQRDWLSALDIWYPDAGRDGKMAHHQLATALDKRNATDAECSALIDALRTEAEQRPERTIIVSSEALQNVNDTVRVKELCRGFDVRVVCYLRESLAWKQSVWAHRIHARPYVGDFREFALSHALNYARFVKRWKAVANTMSIGLFDREHLEGGDVVNDFFARIERPFSAEDRLRIGDSRTNPSIGGNLLYFKLLLNFVQKGAPAQGRQFKTIGELAAAETRWQGRFRVSAADAAAIRRFDRKSNDFLRAHFGYCPEHDPTRSRPCPEPETLTTDLERLLEMPAFRDAFAPLSLVPAFEAGSGSKASRLSA